MMSRMPARRASIICLSLLLLSTPAVSDDPMKKTTVTLPPAIVKKFDYPPGPQINNYPKDREEFSHLLELSSMGNAHFNYILGRIYSDDRLDESEKDYKTSLFYYEKAIALYARHPEALTNLGVLYQRGLGVAKDVKKAVALYERAGEVGSVIAFNNLSVIYAMGDEVPQDFEKAKIYNQNAAHLGDAQSIELLRHWDYYVEISSTKDDKEIEKIAEKYKKIELQKKLSQ
ncbi:sel1 repeat family protein [Pseudomonas sp. NFXW11]|uniref:tetratricopeptide repeat protein n=1 Tax=Pseudomonas sp. NFXW11 TaxID=2819531 RepID=UPI003CF6F1AE